jgi:hypothetical protein
MGMEDA